VEEYDDYQDLYDKETDHSRIGSAQEKWNDKIGKELRQLDDFKNYTEF
jgi:hypothetical protein